MDNASKVNRFNEKPNNQKNVKVEMIEMGIDTKINIRFLNVCKNNSIVIDTRIIAKTKSSITPLTASWVKSETSLAIVNLSFSLL